MKILNSVDNKKYELDDKQITIYNCGPTVYNHVHIGNIRPLITFDVLYRYLLADNKDAILIHNITDIDDKIIAAAKQNNVTEQEISERYRKSYVGLFPILNILQMKMPKVSDHIDDIIAYVRKLIDRGYAYQEDGDVYFDIQKIPNYGKISHKKVDELLDGVRKENKSNKHNPLDFVLWKKTDEGLKWESPWSVGRPGWHTECCVMINKYVGPQITIHGGGVDLKFPHHENENAQNNALFNKDIARFWMHVGHVNVDGQKMSKSLHNFILVKDIINQENAMGLRWFFYQTKYQNPINYVDKILDACTDDVNHLFRIVSAAKTILIANDLQTPQSSEQFDPEFKRYMDDDLNLPNATMVLTKQIKSLNQMISKEQFDLLKQTLAVVYKELNVLGLKYEIADHAAHVDLIKKWKKAVNEKNYQEADKYRQTLIECKLL